MGLKGVGNANGAKQRDMSRQVQRPRSCQSPILLTPAPFATRFPQTRIVHYSKAQYHAQWHTHVLPVANILQQKQLLWCARLLLLLRPTSHLGIKQSSSGLLHTFPPPPLSPSPVFLVVTLL